ncbi:MAG: helix-turn-helix domain-containing protein [Parasporobacterium sp.]|nr:helix-turn-helix domain-containing protein [Parasporobacterium sp.]
MIFTLDMLFEKLEEYSFVVKDQDVLSNEYKTFHLLPENEQYYRPNMIYLTDSYDMVRFNTFRKAQETGRHDCLIYVYEHDEEYEDGASIYIQTTTELAIVLNRMQEFVIDLIMLENGLNGSIVNGAHIGQLLAEIYPMVGNPMKVIDPSLKVVASEGEDSIDSKELLTLMTGEHETYNHDAYSYMICPPDKDCPYERILYRIPTNGIVSMYLYCLNRKEHYKGSILSMLHLFIPYIRQCLLQDPEITRGSVYESLVRDLLAGDALETDAKTRCMAIGIPYASEYLLFSADTKDAPYPDDLICGKIHMIFPSAMPIVYQGQVITLLTETKSKEQIMRKLERLSEELSLVFGISRVFTMITDLKAAFVQAKAARNIGSRLKHSRFAEHYHMLPLTDSDRIYEYQDIAQYHAYDISAKMFDYTWFCLPEILSLIKQTEKSGSNLPVILYEYLSSGCSYIETARRLFMHRNNVVYHINRLKESGFRDLQDPDYIQKVIETYHVLFLLWTPSLELDGNAEPH